MIDPAPHIVGHTRIVLKELDAGIGAAIEAGLDDGFIFLKLVAGGDLVGGEQAVAFGRIEQLFGHAAQPA